LPSTKPATAAEVGKFVLVLPVEIEESTFFFAAAAISLDYKALSAFAPCAAVA
jgi:hypothetical protein